MSFLYDIISDYDKSYDTVTDTGSSGTVTTLYGYLSSFDDVLFSAVSTAINEILTFNSIDHVSDEYIHYLAYMLGYEWNPNLDTDLQRNLLKHILEIYKRKGTKFAFHFNLYQLDPTVQLYEPYKDLFILDKSRYGEDHLPSSDYYSYGILVIKLNAYIPDIFDIIEYLRPAGWKIVIEFNYGIFYSFHIKVKTEERMILENSSNMDYYYSFFSSRIDSYKQTINTPGEVHSNAYTAVSRNADSNVDNLTSYVYVDAVIKITKIYLNNNEVFTPGIDYDINDNTLIVWTQIGMSKIEPGMMYFVDYIKDDKIEASHLLSIDEYIQQKYVAATISDQYIYNEFDVPITGKLTDQQYEEQYVNSLVYINGQYMPITMVGHTFMPAMYHPSVYTVDNAESRYNLSTLLYWYNASILGYTKINDYQFEIILNYTKEYTVGNKFKFNDLSVLATIISSSYNNTTHKTMFTVSYDDRIKYTNGKNQYKLSNNIGNNIQTVACNQLLKNFSMVYNPNFGNTYVIPDTYKVSEVVKVYDDDVNEVQTFIYGTDYNVNGNNIIWTENGNKPIAEFKVDFMYEIILENNIDYMIVNDSNTYYIDLISETKPANNTIFTVKYDYVLPTIANKMLVSAAWPVVGNIVQQLDTNEIYKIIDVTNLDNDNGYSLQIYPIDIVLNRSSIVPPLNGMFRIQDFGNHHILYETDDELYTLYRFSLQYAEYQLLNGDIFVEGGDKTIIIPNGISEVIITTCGGGGGASKQYNISNYMYNVSTGGGGGAVKYKYKLKVSPGDTIRLVGGLGGIIERNGEPSYAAIKRTDGTDFEIISATYAEPGKAPVDITNLNIPKSGIYGISWYGGEAGGTYSGSGGSIWSTNNSLNQMSSSSIMTYMYSDYGNNGMSFGGKSIITNGLICGGGGSFGVGGGIDGPPGYGGGGCNSLIAGDGVGGVGFARLEYDVSQILDENNSPIFVEITPTVLTLKVGEFYTLAYTILPESNWPYSWYSYDSNIASVNDNGMVVGNSVGKTYISLTSVIRTAICEVTVIENIIYITNIAIFGDQVMNINTMQQLTVSILPNNATNKEVMYSSSNENILTVSENGLVKAVNYGTATITAFTTDGSNLSAAITITVEMNTPNSIHINQQNVELTVGETLQLTATIDPPQKP